MIANQCVEREQLLDYLQGLSDQDSSDQIEKHISECAACENSFAELENNPQNYGLSGVESLPIASENSINQPASVVQNVIKNAKTLQVPAAPSLQGKSIGNYQLLEPIGQGGMAIVYKAINKKLGKTVAIKILRSSVAGPPLERIEREIQAHGRLDHPAIVSAIDAGEEGAIQYLVTEFVDGMDLRKIGRACGSLSVPDACEIIRQAALGIGTAHQAGIIHRDLKPSNIMIDRIGSVKVLDFGLVFFEDWTEPNLELTSVGQLLGTLDYMAPEQAENPTGVDLRTDIYSLGATLFCLLAGRAPFAASLNQSPLEKLRLLALESPPKLKTLRPDVPEGLSSLIENCLSQDSSIRPSSTAHLAEKLTPYCNNHRLDQLLETAKNQADKNPEIDTEPDAQLPVLQTAAGGGRSSWMKNLALGFFFFGFLLLSIVIVLQTNQGQIVIEVPDEKIKVEVVRSGKVHQELVLNPGPNSVHLFAGNYQIRIKEKADKYSISNNSVVLGRGKLVLAKITKIPNRRGSGIRSSDPNTPVLGSNNIGVETTAQNPIPNGFADNQVDPRINSQPNNFPIGSNQQPSIQPPVNQNSLSSNNGNSFQSPPPNNQFGNPSLPSDFGSSPNSNSSNPLRRGIGSPSLGSPATGASLPPDNSGFSNRSQNPNGSNNHGGFRSQLPAGNFHQGRVQNLNQLGSSNNKDSLPSGLPTNSETANIASPNHQLPTGTNLNRPGNNPPRNSSGPLPADNSHGPPRTNSEGPIPNPSTGSAESLPTVDDAITPALSPISSQRPKNHSKSPGSSSELPNKVDDLPGPTTSSSLEPDSETLPIPTDSGSSIPGPKPGKKQDPSLNTVDGKTLSYWLDVMIREQNPKLVSAAIDAIVLLAEEKNDDQIREAITKTFVQGKRKLMRINLSNIKIQRPFTVDQLNRIDAAIENAPKNLAKKMLSSRTSILFVQLRTDFSEKRFYRLFEKTQKLSDRVFGKAEKQPWDIHDTETFIAKEITRTYLVGKKWDDKSSRHRSCVKSMMNSAAFRRSISKLSFGTTSTNIFGSAPLTKYAPKESIHTNIDYLKTELLLRNFKEPNERVKPIVELSINFHRPYLMRKSQKARFISLLDHSISEAHRLAKKSGDIDLGLKAAKDILAEGGFQTFAIGTNSGGKGGSIGESGGIGGDLGGGGKGGAESGGTFGAIHNSGGKKFDDKNWKELAPSSVHSLFKNQKEQNAFLEKHSDLCVIGGGGLYFFWDENPKGYRRSVSRKKVAVHDNKLFFTCHNYGTTSHYEGQTLSEVISPSVEIAYAQTYAILHKKHDSSKLPIPLKELILSALSKWDRLIKHIPNSIGGPAQPLFSRSSSDKKSLIKFQKKSGEEMDSQPELYLDPSFEYGMGFTYYFLKNVGIKNIIPNK